jgi:hypothetical protein
MILDKKTNHYGKRLTWSRQNLLLINILRRVAVAGIQVKNQFFQTVLIKQSVIYLRVRNVLQRRSSETEGARRVKEQPDPGVQVKTVIVSMLQRLNQGHALAAHAIIFSKRNSTSYGGGHGQAMNLRSSGCLEGLHIVMEENLPRKYEATS